MEKQFFAMAGAFIGKEKFPRVLFASLFSFILFGCASSDVSRDVSSNIDVGVQNTKNVVDSSTDGDITDSYGNANQAVKGALLGGAAGAITGSFTPGFGILAGTAVGAILGGSYGAYIDTNSSLSDQLQNRGATVVELGDQVMIALPSAQIFNPLTPTIKPSAYSTLNLVTRYVNQYTKMLVKVAVYTNSSGADRYDLSLSQQEANSVVKYLQAAGMDSRLLYGVGYGGTHQVTNNALGWDASDNYRVEITLEKQYL